MQANSVIWKSLWGMAVGWLMGCMSSGNVISQVMEPIPPKGKNVQKVISEGDGGRSGKTFCELIGGNANDGTNSVVIDKNGNIILGGFTEDDNEDIYVVKLNSHGEFLWSQVIESENREWIMSMALDSSNGDIMAVGTIVFKPIEEDNPPDVGIFVVKLDSEGRFLWRKVIALPKLEGKPVGACSPKKVIMAPDGDFVVVGTILLHEERQSDMYLMKITPEGEILWQKRIGGPFDDIGATVAFDKENNLILGGYGQWHDSTDTYDVDGYDNDVYFLKLSPDSGELLWEKRIGTKVWLESLSEMVVDPDGNFLLVGSYVTPLGVELPFIVKLDNQLNVVWRWYQFLILSNKIGPKHPSIYMYDTYDEEGNPVAIIERGDVDDISILESGNIVVLGEKYYPLGISYIFMSELTPDGCISRYSMIGENQGEVLLSLNVHPSGELILGGTARMLPQYDGNNGANDSATGMRRVDPSLYVIRTNFQHPGCSVCKMEMYNDRHECPEELRKDDHFMEVRVNDFDFFVEDVETEVIPIDFHVLPHQSRSLICR